MIVRQEFIAKNTNPRPGVLLSKPTSITIHWIGPYPRQDPADPIKWWVDNNLQASAHFVVKDDVVINCIPTTEVAWHCGSKGNYTSIGIEVIPANAMGQFSEDSIESIKQIITRWSKLQLLRHFDWTGKDCPRYYTDIVDLVGADGRVENPVGGTDRWKKLVEELRGENNGSNT